MTPSGFFQNVKPMLNHLSTGFVGFGIASVVVNVGLFAMMRTAPSVYALAADAAARRELLDYDARAVIATYLVITVCAAWMLEILAGKRGRRILTQPFFMLAWGALALANFTIGALFIGSWPTVVAAVTREEPAVLSRDLNALSTMVLTLDLTAVLFLFAGWIALQAPSAVLALFTRPSRAARSSADERA